MKAKKQKNWYEEVQDDFPERVRYRAKYKEMVRKRFKGKSMQERFDKLLEEFFKDKV